MAKWSEQPPYTYGIAFASWMFFTLLINLHPQSMYLLDPLNTLFTGALIAREWYRLPPFGAIRWGESALVGIGAFGLEVLLSPTYEHRHVRETEFNPLSFFGPGEMTYGLYFFHLLGLVIIAPMAAEIFWRGFFMRYLIQKNFQSVPLGFCTPISFLVTTLFIALMQGSDWPKALASATILGLWFVYTRGLGNVMAAHTMSNLFLGLYVLLSKSWQLW